MTEKRELTSEELSSLHRLKLYAPYYHVYGWFDEEKFYMAAKPTKHHCNNLLRKGKTIYHMK